MHDRLLDLARNGDGPALGKLLAHYRHYLKVLARVQIGTRLQGKVGSSDVVQEACAEAHRNLGLFRGTTEGEFSAWLRQILATRLALLFRHYLGTRGRDVRLERELAAQLDRSSLVMDQALVAMDGSPSQGAVRREQAVQLADALEQLPEHYREVIVLRHMKGLSFAEIARQMRRTDDSVQKLWVRGLAELRRHVRDEE